jgi:hypothetical protein
VLFAIEKTFEFTAAGSAFEKTGCEDRDENGERIARLIDALLPLLTQATSFR